MSEVERFGGRMAVSKEDTAVPVIWERTVLEENTFSTGDAQVAGDGRPDSIYIDIPEGSITPTDARAYALMLLAAAEVADAR